MKIVIIEDCQDYSQSLAEALRLAGHEVHTFCDWCGTERIGSSLTDLVERIKKLAADRILVDHELGDNSPTGAEVVAGLPEVERNKFISISSDTRGYCARQYFDKHRVVRGKGVKEFVEFVTQ